MAAKSTGVTSASVIIVVLVGAAVGALTGLLLDGLVENSAVLAIISGLVATVVATLVRYKLVYRLAGAGPDDSRIPSLLLVNAVIASIAGSLAGHNIASLIDIAPSAVGTGALAGLLSAVLMAILMVTYYTIPSSRPS